jgi:hypothetical protein
VGTVERRRNPRFEVRVSARVTLPQGEPVHGEVVDICREAVLLALPRDVEMDTSVAVEVSLPGFLGVFEASGRVVRLAGSLAEGRGVVVLFTEMNPNAATAIDLYIERLASNDGPSTNAGS